MRDAAAIGQILNCPKCASMMHVAAPEGWQADDAAAGSGRRRWENEVQPGEKVAEADATPATSSSGGLRLSDSSGGASSTSSNLSASGVSAKDGLEQDARAPAPDESVGAAAVRRLFATKWVVMAGASAMLVALAAGVWLARRSPQPTETPPAVVNTAGPLKPAAKAEQVTRPQEASVAPQPVRLARRWLPTGAQAVVSLRPELLFNEPAARVVLDRTAALWQPAIDKLASALGLEPQSFERVTWSSINIADIADETWLTQAVVVVELDRPIDAAARGILDGEPLDWKLDEAPVRVLKSRAWPHPFAVIDKRLIVTGPEERLRELAAREEHRLANDALEQLVDSLDARRAAVSLIDLRALREADGLPEWSALVDVLHADGDDWKLLRAMPLALGLAIGLDERIELETDLACDGESGAEQVHAALDRVLESAESTLAAEAEVLTGKLLAGPVNTTVADELKHFLAGSQAALARRASGVRDSIAWARLDWQGDLPRLASGFLAGIPQLESHRLAAVRQLDEEHHRLLLEGLASYVKAEGGLPAGAAGAALLPPETRLSWQATLLPYYGHLDWHGELNFARTWNDPINQQVTRRPLELLVNPALGPSATKAGFPVTHYVGMAGLGANAGRLDADDPRSGVFGFRPRYSPDQIPDGASNTIALAGVSRKLGPWASGGAATVRGLTQRPYINGPDGFGSGQPDGMLVGMADGAVRFLSTDIDPAVLERLVTVAGGELPIDPVATATEPAAAMPADDTPAKPVPPAKPGPNLPPIDIARRLSDRIPQIELKNNTTLSQLIDMLSQLSTIAITVDADALAEAGIDADAKVSLSMSDTTVGEVLEAALRQFDLKYVAVGNQLVVTPAGRPAVPVR